MTAKRQNPRRFRPTYGQVYENAGGGRYLCKAFIDECEIAKMQNVKSGWTCFAHGIVRYDDDTIEWDYSTGGHFETVREDPDASEAAIIHHRQRSMMNALLCCMI